MMQKAIYGGFIVAISLIGSFSAFAQSDCDNPRDDFDSMYLSK
jgi:hypothetical protein